ncbi:MAG: response regulator [Candidatus Lutacidiplasmatales archaeon]
MRLLIVDDDAVFRQELADLLEGEHHVTPVPSVAKAVEALESEDFDVVFTDLKMPRQSGLDLLREVRRRWPSTLVVMITGFATVETAVEAMKEGAFDYVRKPFRIAQVLAALELARSEFRFRAPASDTPGPDTTARRWSEREGLSVLHLTTRTVRAQRGVIVAPTDPANPFRMRETVENFLSDHPRAGVILEDADLLFAQHRRADALEFLTALRDRTELRGPLLVTFDPRVLSAVDTADLRAAVAAPRTRATLEALASPIRRAVLRRAAKGPCSFTEAMAAADLDDSPKLSFHLRKLVDEGLLGHPGEEYRITPRGLEAVRLLEEMDAIPSHGIAESDARPLPRGAEP